MNAYHIYELYVALNNIYLSMNVPIFPNLNKNSSSSYHNVLNIGHTWPRVSFSGSLAEIVLLSSDLQIVATNSSVARLFSKVMSLKSLNALTIPLPTHNPQRPPGQLSRSSVCLMFPFALILSFRQRSVLFLRGQGGEVNAYFPMTLSLFSVFLLTKIR